MQNILGNLKKRLEIWEDTIADAREILRLYTLSQKWKIKWVCCTKKKKKKCIGKSL